jgi:hypothetical protein
MRTMHGEKFPNCSRFNISIILRNKNMATVSHRVSRDKISACDWLDTLHRVKMLLYLVTAEPRTVSQNRSRIWRTFSELKMINFE